MASSTSPSHAISGFPLWQAGLIAALAAAVANAIVYGLSQLFDTLPDSVLVESPAGEEPITLLPILILSFIPILLATGVFALLKRFTAQPSPILWITGMILMLLSLFSPVTIADAPADMKTTLVVMHIVAAIVGLGVLTRLVRR